jgi:hypothetical protein
MVFTKPTQVKFLDADYDHYVGGIAYGNEIICGCCGSIFDIDELLEDADPTDPRPVIIPLEWIDISNEIKGDD